MHERRSILRAWLGWWVLCAALWLALVDRTALDELLTGVVAAAIGATAAVLVRQQRRQLILPRPRWAAGAWKPLLALVRDLAPLARALVRRGVLRRSETGVVHSLPFPAVEDDPRALGYRVATAILGSLGPNTIVLEIDTDARVMHVHQLVPSDDPAAAAMPLERP